jgi:hypothetical protein
VHARAVTTWDDFAADASDLAAAVRARFEATGLGFLATLRRDGSPRISGIEPFIWDGEVWLGMMPGSRKAVDCLRDPRIAVHAASVDKEVKEGDAKVAGRAIPVDDPDRLAEMTAAFAEATGYKPDGPFPLFTLDLTEVVHTRPDGDHLLIESWTPDRGYRRVERK